MNNKSLLFILIILFCLKIYGQTERAVIFGKIKGDSISLENIHIINKSSQKGTITNNYGEFKIPVKENDTLIFSSIQFEFKQHIVSLKELKSASIVIHLIAKINNLDEIVVKNHDLSGFLKNDLENTNLKNQVDAFSLNLPNAGKAPVTEVDFINRKINYYSKGGSLNKLYGWVSGKKKELKKLRSIETESVILLKIRELVTDKYLTETLNIKKEDIPAFIEYCKSKGIIKLFQQNKKDQVIDIIIKESITFKR
jgi:hypothetical protein